METAKTEVSNQNDKIEPKKQHSTLSTFVEGVVSSRRLSQTEWVQWKSLTSASVNKEAADEYGYLVFTAPSSWTIDGVVDWILSPVNRFKACTEVNWLYGDRLYVSLQLAPRKQSCGIYIRNHEEQKTCYTKSTFRGRSTIKHHVVRVLGMIVRPDVERKGIEVSLLKELAQTLKRHNCCLHVKIDGTQSRMYNYCQSLQTTRGRLQDSWYVYCKM